MVHFQDESLNLLCPLYIYVEKVMPKLAYGGYQDMGIPCFPFPKQLLQKWQEQGNLNPKNIVIESIA